MASQYLTRRILSLSLSTRSFPACYNPVQNHTLKAPLITRGNYPLGRRYAGHNVSNGRCTTLRRRDAERKNAVRIDMLRANRALLTEPVLFGILLRDELVKAGETERALRAFTFGLEAAEAADHLSARLGLLLGLADIREQIGPSAAVLDILERVRTRIAATKSVS